MRIFALLVLAVGFVAPVMAADKPSLDGAWVVDLSSVAGVDESADFSNLSVFSHTDLTRALEYPERFERITELADAVVIDEAHT